MKYFFNILTLIFLTLLSSCEEKEISIESPDKSMTLKFQMENNKAYYSFLKDNDTLMLPSRLGFELNNNVSLSEGFEVVNVSSNSHQSKWQQPWGQFKTVEDNHNELLVELKNKDNGVLLNIRFRLFNDGLGFRYEFPEQENLKDFEILDEVTEFRFNEDPEAWYIPVHEENSYYESHYRNKLLSATDTLNTPATFELKNGTHLAIHEADLTDFASMTLLNTGDKVLKSYLVPWSNGVKVYASAPSKSPWRIIIAGDNAGDLLTSTMMLNLNEPNKIDDLSWIETSKYIGIWWGMHLEKYTWGSGDKHGATTENAKEYIDFASKNGLDGVLIEGWNVGWDGDWTADGTAFDFTKAYPDFDLEEVCRYAAMNNVRIIGHHETAGMASHYESQLNDAFKLYQKNGVNAVKTGYVGQLLDKKEWHDSQYGVRHYRKVIETAARHKIMIDNHEPVKGTGIERTYPNYMTAEGVRGQEYNAWAADGGNKPSHTTIIPFTRMLAGAIDFTPGNFNFDYDRVEGTRVNTTLAKQLALYVVIHSPLQMASDLPENYEGKKEFEFVKDVPCKWSTTKVLDSKIGDFAVIARKDWDEKNWYLGAITNENARELNYDLSFLDEGKSYKATIYKDGVNANYKTNPYPVAIEEKIVDNNSNIQLKLAPGGGSAVKFELIN